MGLWEKEEQRHAPVLIRVYQQLTGEKFIPQSKKARLYQPTNKPQEHYKMTAQLLRPITAEKLIKLPQHIAIIMDGNGRWATQRQLPRIAGHRQGAKTLKNILRYCKDLGIKTLTVYAFSTENWNRPKQEVNFLMGLFKNLLQTELLEMHKEGVRLNLLGEFNLLPNSLQQIMQQAILKTKDNQEICLNIALNYGSRQEITQACKTIAEQVEKGLIKAEEIIPELLENYLYTKGMSEPDLLIRTSGEMRLSNFLLWQIAYSEIYVTKTLWPDFNPNELYQALLTYQKRKRRFGKIR